MDSPLSSLPEKSDLTLSLWSTMATQCLALPLSPKRMMPRESMLVFYLKAMLASLFSLQVYCTMFSTNNINYLFLGLKQHFLFCLDTWRKILVLVVYIRTSSLITFVNFMMSVALIRAIGYCKHTYL